MNRRIRFVQPIYEFVDSERRYGEMASQGWLLERRGSALELYRRGAPESRQYRLEFRPTRFMSGAQEMDDEELAVFADCGWEPVSQSGGVYVFSSPGAGDAAELYTDTEGRIALLKHARKYSGGAGIAWLAVWVSMTVFRLAAGSPNLLNAGGLFGGDWLSLLLLALVLSVLWGAFYRAYRCNRLLRLVKKGVSLRSGEASGRHPVGAVMGRLLGGILAVCAAGSLFLLVTSGAKPLPEAAPEAPYLLLGEVFPGQRVGSAYGVKVDNSVRVQRGLLSENYDVEEALALPDGDILWLDQQVFLLRWGSGAAEDLAKSLLRATPFAGDQWGGEREIAIPGFDYVITATYACAAVKGDRVVCLVGANDRLNASWEQVLETLLGKWA